MTNTHPRYLPVDESTGNLLWQDLVTASPALVRVLTKMVAYHFKDRYQSAAEVVKLLKNYAPVIIVDRALTLHHLTTVSKEVWREFNSSLTLEISFQVSNLTSLSTGLG